MLTDDARLRIYPLHNLVSGSSCFDSSKRDFLPRCRITQVIYITHDIGKNDVLEARAGDHSNPEREETSQRKAFLRELNAMIRLRGPHTVNVYGAITSRPDRLVLVMELLTLDLRTMLKTSKEPLPEDQSRRIIVDICAGMSFLHTRETVHGDLKSANVLLDGNGRAKVWVFRRGTVVGATLARLAFVHLERRPQFRARWPYTSFDGDRRIATRVKSRAPNNLRPRSIQTIRFRLFVMVLRKSS